MPLETPPWRVKNPWRTPPIEARLGAESIILSDVTMAGRRSIADQMSPKGGGGASPLDCSASILNSSPHLARIGKPGRTRQDRLPSDPASRSAADDRSVTASPSLSRNSPCGIGPKAASPSRARRLLERGEIDMGGEVGFARCGERIGETMALNGLQRIADAALA